MIDWQAEVEARVSGADEARVDALMKLLESAGGSVSYGREVLGATFTVEARTPEFAAQTAAKTFRTHLHALGYDQVDVVELGVQTHERASRGQGEQEEEPPIGVTEIAKMLGVSKQRAHQLTRLERWPKPLYRTLAGPAWSRAEVTKALEVIRPPAGRPRGPGTA